MASHTANTELTTPYYFYTFPNASGDSPTRLIIKGTFDADGSGAASTAATRYYPIVINKKQANTTILQGREQTRAALIPTLNTCLPPLSKAKVHLMTIRI